MRARTTEFSAKAFLLLSYVVAQRAGRCRDVRVRYTLTFHAKANLSGHEREWRDPASRRQIHLTSLCDAGGIAEGPTKISNYSTGADCQSTLACMRALGAGSRKARRRSLRSRPWPGWIARACRRARRRQLGLYHSNALGILAAQPFVTTIGGDESLSKRPMQRIMKPLAEMGAHIDAREDRFPPLTDSRGQAPSRSTTRCPWRARR
jgi:hypothetical protein